MQHVRDEIAHVDGGTHRAIEKKEGPEEGRQGIRLELQLSQELQRQQIARFAPGELVNRQSLGALSSESKLNRRESLVLRNLTCVIQWINLNIVSHKLTNCCYVTLRFLLDFYLIFYISFDTDF